MWAVFVVVCLQGEGGINCTAHLRHPDRHHSEAGCAATVKGVADEAHYRLVDAEFAVATVLAGCQVMGVDL